jgi:O-antigen ligase
MIVYLPRLRARHYLTILAGIILGTVVALQIPTIANFLSYRAGDAISSGGTGRTDIWLVSWQMYLERPVLGIGWRMAEYVMDVTHLERVPIGVTWDDYRFRPRVTHNIYLQTLLELGIIGFILFTTWIVPLVRAPVHRDKNIRDEWLVALAIFVAMLVGGLTNPEFHKKYFWFALALPQGLRYYWMQTKSFVYKTPAKPTKDDMHQQTI